MISIAITDSQQNPFLFIFAGQGVGQAGVVTCFGDVWVAPLFGTVTSQRNHGLL